MTDQKIRVMIVDDQFIVRSGLSTFVGVQPDLTLMVEGLSNPQIAEQLIVSLSTVKFHVSSILGKLQATTRSEAVRLALQHHLVDESEF